MANINIDTVVHRLDNFVSRSGDARNKLMDINNSYIEGTNQQWNTEYAATQYIDPLCSEFNDFIDQFNKNYQDGVDEFVKGVNLLLKSENNDPIPQKSVQKLRKFKRTWAAQHRIFKIPEDYGQFTSDNLTKGITEFNQILNLMQVDINYAVHNGLDGKYCNKLSESLKKLKESAEKVSEKYSSDAAKAAVEKDEIVRIIQSSS